jgi:hypothetical protein
MAELKALISLAGLVGRIGAPLTCKRPDAAVTFNPGVELLHDNPLRAWAIIQNLDTNPVDVQQC